MCPSISSGKQPILGHAVSPLAMLRAGTDHGATNSPDEEKIMARDDRYQTSDTAMRTNSTDGTSGSAAGTLIVAAAAFLFVIGVGATASYVGDHPETASSEDALSISLSPFESNVEMLARLADYTRLTETEESASTAATGELLPDVNTMTDRLAARLETTPEDIEGWTLLMRSRVVLGEKEVAATAFRKALEVFKDDSAASGKITATAIELGLKAE
jgi:hypothetical protein